MPARKEKTVYVCNECGATSPKWAGQCGDCGAWNSLSETVAAKPSSSLHPRFQGYAGAASTQNQVQSLADVDSAETPRHPTQLSELDRVLGGGLVNGSVVLIGGDPGVGKSTLLIQTLTRLQEHLPTLYISGEESLQQISLRAHRLGLNAEHVKLLAETQLEQMIAHMAQQQARVVVIDSIQTIYTELIQSAPGSVSQLRETTAQLVRYAKQSGTTLLLVGHVTKEGALAGPRVLEHMVDTVLYFEGDTNTQYRAIRAIKNRFGAVNELGFFAMTDKGLREINHPSAIFLSRHQQTVSGSAIMVTREGSRPMLIEVQALVTDSMAAQPRRVSVGIDQNRLNLLLAILQRHGDIALYGQDVFINIVGGVKITETAVDLATILAILSSFRDRPLQQQCIVFGEVGLAGEIRPVQGGVERLREAVKHGFTDAIVPHANVPKEGIAGLNIVPVQTLRQAIEAISQ